MSDGLKKSLSIILIILIVLTLIFIFTRSMKSVEVSSNESEAISDIVKPIIDPQDKLPEEKFHNGIRKAAHFIEFSVLGTEIFLLFNLLFFKTKKNILPGILIALLFCFLAATVDETIQLFTNRGSSVIDVWLDSLGSLTAIIIFLGLKMLIRLIKRKSKAKSFD